MMSTFSRHLLFGIFVEIHCQNGTSAELTDCPGVSSPRVLGAITSRKRLRMCPLHPPHFRSKTPAENAKSIVRNNQNIIVDPPPEYALLAPRPSSDWLSSAAKGNHAFRVFLPVPHTIPDVPSSYSVLSYQTTVTVL